MSEDVSELSGAHQAAVFLLGIGESAAAAVLKQMSPREVQLVGEAMARLETVSRDVFAKVASSFTQEVSAVDPSGVGAEDYTRRVLTVALGESRAKNLFNKMMQKSNSKGFDALGWMDPHSVAAILHKEHPQIVAIVLSHLEPDHASEVLAELPEDFRADVVLRIARLENIDSEIFEELDEMLQQQLGKQQRLPPTLVEGTKLAAGILNHLDQEVENQIMENLREADEILGEKISELMFIFDDLMQLDDRSMQRLLREVSTDSLAIALKGSDSKLMDKFLNNMSSRAAEMLKDDIEYRGPMKLSEVEFAQKEIINVAGKLAEEGEITLGNKGGEALV